jgi:hypothetical protein
MARAILPEIFTAALATAATGVTAACAPSALIAAGDPAFARANARVERTTAAVEATDAPPRERTVFLQAEALYRYRFTPPARGAASLTAEAAAALTDFPVLQSFAGSLDIASLRSRSAEAAVQVWETFLLRYPQSTLRPLALYRLGWAYRSVGVSGLPRESGDAAFDALSRCGAPPAIASVLPEARSVRWKSKDAASYWSLLPGLGQIYVGEPASGVVRLVIALASATAIAVPLVIGLHRSSDLSWKHDWPLLVSGTAGLVVLSWDYTSSYEDAMHGVVRWNERAEDAFEDAHPDAP